MQYLPAVFAGLVALAALAPGPEYPEPKLSYSDIDAILARQGPMEYGADADILDTDRARALMAIDRHIAHEGPLSDPLAAFYQGRIDKALDAIEHVPAPEQGAMVWKMYSSGFVVKTKEICFSVDVVEGPVQSELATAEQMNARTEPMLAGGGRRVHQVKLHWTPEQRRKFAGLVDAHFVTHRHYDHASFTLVGELLAGAKTVVAPRDLKELYVNAGMPKAEDIVIPDYSGPNTIAGMQMLVFLGYQDRYRVEEVDGEQRWVWNENPPMNNVYVFQAGGLSIMHNGDCRGYDQEFYPWLVGLMHTEWEPDVCLLIEYFRNARKTVQNLYDPFIIPCHELELGHVRIDDAGEMHLHVSGYTSRLRGYAGRIREAKAAVMTWGEALLLRPSSPPTKE